MPGPGREGGEGATGCLEAAAAPLDDGDEEDKAAADAIDGDAGDVELLLRPPELDFATSKPAPLLDDEGDEDAPLPLGCGVLRAWTRTVGPRTASCCRCRADANPRVKFIEDAFFVFSINSSFSGMYTLPDSREATSDDYRSRDHPLVSKSKREKQTRGRRKGERRCDDDDDDDDAGAFDF